jgi:hypothetical protein
LRPSRLRRREEALSQLSATTLPRPLHTRSAFSLQSRNPLTPSPSHHCSIDSLLSSSSSTFYICYTSISHPRMQIECCWASIYLLQVQIKHWRRFLLPGHRSSAVRL